MKALFIGLGSVGQRHLQNFKKITDEKTTEIFAYRAGQQENVIKNGKAVPCKSLAKYYKFTEFRDFEEALAQKPDLAFICNPSRFHLETAISLAYSSCPIFIEKPLGTEVSHLDKLERIIAEKNLITMVGFQSRFNPCVIEIKKMLDEGRFGNVISAQFNWSTYLPSHHPYEDYRGGYAAREDLGGGVTFCLSHELDLIQYFFKKPISVYAVLGGESALEMDVEDTVSSLFSCEDTFGKFPVSLHLSFSQGVEKRVFTILMRDAYIECNLQNNKLKVTNHNQEVICEKNFNTVERNELFVEEVKHFINCVASNRETDIPVAEGKKSLLMALAVHSSIRSGKVEIID